MTQTLERLADYPEVTAEDMDLITKNIGYLVLLSPALDIDAERQKREYDDKVGTFVLGYN
jgi:hypothetical protein